MKKASTLISVIVAVVMLLAALGVGFSVKQFRANRAEKAVQAEVEAKPEVKQSGEKAALPGRGGRRRGGMGMSEEERQAMRERYENMSEEERQTAREEMRQRFGGRRRGDRGGGPGGSPDGGFRRRDEGEGTREENPDNPPEN